MFFVYILFFSFSMVRWVAVVFRIRGRFGLVVFWAFVVEILSFFVRKSSFTWVIIVC